MPRAWRKLQKVAYSYSIPRDHKSCQLTYLIPWILKAVSSPVEAKPFPMPMSHYKSWCSYPTGQCFLYLDAEAQFEYTNFNLRVNWMFFYFPLLIYNFNSNPWFTKNFLKLWIKMQLPTLKLFPSCDWSQCHNYMLTSHLPPFLVRLTYSSQAL